MHYDRKFKTFRTQSYPSKELINLEKIFSIAHYFLWTMETVFHSSVIKVGSLTYVPT